MGVLCYAMPTMFKMQGNDNTACTLPAEYRVQSYAMHAYMHASTTIWHVNDTFLNRFSLTRHVARPPFQCRVAHPMTNCW